MDTQNQIAIIPAPKALLAIITASGPAAPEWFLEFFAASLRNTPPRLMPPDHAIPNVA